MKIYAWPPVGVTGQGWWPDAPLNTSRSLLTGKTYHSRSQPTRKVAHLSASGVGSGGYMESLIRLIDGGLHLVRLRSHPLIWEGSGLPEAQQILWVSGDQPLDWQHQGQPLTWYSDDFYSGTPTTLNGVPAITVSGLPASRLVARAGEFLAVMATTRETRMAVRDVYSDASGVATIPVVEAFPEAGAVDLPTRETGVFKATSIPRPFRQAGQDWSYDWEFREWLPEEYAGAEELNPW